MHLFTRINNYVIFSEAARRIAASGIPILTRASTEPSISRELSIRRTTPALDRVPSRTIRPPPMRVPINQLPRIRRRADAPVRARPAPAPPATTTTTAAANPARSVSSSFIDNLLRSQQRLHNMQSVRLHG